MKGTLKNELRLPCKIINYFKELVAPPAGFEPTAPVPKINVDPARARASSNRALEQSLRFAGADPVSRAEGRFPPSAGSMREILSGIVRNATSFSTTSRGTFALLHFDLDFPGQLQIRQRRLNLADHICHLVGIKLQCKIDGRVGCALERSFGMTRMADLFQSSGGMIPVRTMVFAPAAAGTGSSSDGLGAASASVIFVPDSRCSLSAFVKQVRAKKSAGFV